MKKIVTGTLAGVALMATTACTTTYEFDAEPTSDKTNPRDIECFNIEAEPSSGDDVNLGEYCKE